MRKSSHVASLPGAGKEGAAQMVKVTGLTKRFGRMTAVADVSFTAYPGEVFGLLGENGAGKTTTLRMLATLLAPDEGTAVINGRELRTEPEAVRQQLGVVFEGGVYDRLTTRENLMYFGRLYGIATSDLGARVEELLRRFEMMEYAGRRAGRLSKGMRQKVVLARALVHNPPVLILDEPTSGLDVTARRLVHSFITEAKEQGKTVILSSHNMGEVESLCHRAAVIHRGQIAAEGTLEELRAQGGSLEDIFVRLVGDES